ncbi:endo-1,4-beta-xylanase [Stieleria sp. TO1_6]|uniref:endo-1,4-beta-xylanase n=1 Tax=Stieleria tagensis TaxID=2956795 RepID=UPI00209A6A32|nr:endo-1,4-beta-xylanase [Stieleria tagensis]MCO8122418.1 endo-1,4-beta-xylanase [Stieleria tagensis]
MLVLLSFTPFLVVAGASVAQESSGPTDTAALKEVVGNRFKIGVGVSEQILSDPKCSDLIREQFQILTPENCMKPQGIHPEEDRWNFAAPDRFVAFAKQNNLEVVGHCLVWAKDDRTDEWMKNGKDGNAVSRDELLARIEDHVATVVGRYQETATMWDVVNEALADGDEGYLRESVYSTTAGIDFIEMAFRTARKHDPDALLIYNDYNCHFPGKRKKLIRLLTELKERGVPVDAYGMQGHFELGDDSITQLRETFEALRGLGIQIVVSELDIDVVTRGKWWSEDGKYRDELKTYDPYKDGLPRDVERRVTDQYVALFRLFDEYQETIARVSFWNLHDGQSWLNYFPWDRTNYPLLFDRELKPKPVYDAVINVLRDSTPVRAKPIQTGTGHAPHERTDWVSRAAHEQLLRKAKQGKVDIYFQGDSITRRWGATDYPHLLEHWKKSFHGWNAANFAWGGDNTHNILWRMRNGELDGLIPKIVVLQAGTNNLPWEGAAKQATIDDVVDGVVAIIDEFSQRCPDAAIVLTGLFPRDQNTDLTPTIKEINARLHSLAMDRQIRFLNLNAQLTDAEGRFLPGYSSDGLHLERPAYEVWASALRPIFQGILGPPAATDDAPNPTGVPSETDP